MSTDAKHLRVLLPPDSIVYTVAMPESRTGSTTRVLVLAVVAGKIVSVTAAGRGGSGSAARAR
jgi:hypothetical protein